MTMPFPTKPPAPLKAGKFRFPASESFTLENGMELTVVENRRLPLVGIQLGIISGLTRAEHEKPGITAIAADMLCKGTAKRPAEQIAEEIDFLGTDIRAAGTKDYSLLSASVLSDFIDDGILTFFYDRLEFSLYSGWYEDFMNDVFGFLHFTKGVSAVDGVSFFHMGFKRPFFLPI